jgi:predicted transcriptional regulator
MSRLAVTVARMVRSRRLERDWSVARLSLRSGVGRATIYRVEAGWEGASVAVVERLAVALHLDLSALITRNDGKNREEG